MSRKKREPIVSDADQDAAAKTEGRKLYRAQADALAASQVNYGRRRLKIAPAKQKRNDT